MSISKTGKCSFQNVRLPTKIHSKAKSYAQDKGMTLTGVLTRAVLDYLANKDEKNL